mgnify:FL=1
MMTLKVQVTENDVAVTKRLIKIFTVQCTNVSEFVERKKMDSSSKNVQEDALISVGPAYNPANGNPIGEK